MSAAFTPGPWQSKDDYTVAGATTIIANVDGESFSDGTTSYTYEFIATCEDEYGERSDRAQANARLIRTAPDLYAALSAAPSLPTSFDQYDRFASEYRAFREKRTAALAKARGDL